MTNAPSCVALGIGLLTNTSFALAQTSNSILVAQITGSVPSSGVLATPSPAPVAVPPSGVLATAEPRFDTIAPAKAGQKPLTRNRSRPDTTSRHVVHQPRLTERRRAMRAATVDQNLAIAPAPSLGQDVWFSNIGKGKAPK